MNWLLSISIKNLIDPEFYINHGGIWALLFVVFAETGLMFGFIFPGDSLIFIAGIYSEQLIDSLISEGVGSEFINLLILIVALSLCAIAGNVTGYWFGKKSGPYIFKKKDSVIFKKKYLVQAKKFYDDYGAETIIFSRFLPTVRTFVPIVAGVVEMNKSKFMLYNILGGILWIASMTITGHYLNKFLIDSLGIDMKNYLEVIVFGLIIITAIPFIWKYFSVKRKKNSDDNSL